MAAMSKAFSPRVSTLAVGVCLLAISGCGEPSLADSAEGVDGPSVSVDPLVGAVGSVRLGATSAVVARVFGRGRASDPSVPIDADADAIGAPANYGFAAPCDGYPDAGDRGAFPANIGVTEISYRWATASFCRDRAFILLVATRGAKTTAGIKVGDPLESTRRAYPTLRCGSSTGSTIDPPVPVYRYCSGRIAPNRYLYFGQDPISSIGVSSVPLS